VIASLFLYYVQRHCESYKYFLNSTYVDIIISLKLYTFENNTAKSEIPRKPVARVAIDQDASELCTRKIYQDTFRTLHVQNLPGCFRTLHAQNLPECFQNFARAKFTRMLSELCTRKIYKDASELQNVNTNLFSASVHIHPGWKLKIHFLLPQSTV